MRKTFLCLFVALMAMTANLKAQTIVFTDGFESGTLDKWTQEAVAGNTAWDVESTASELKYPATVFQGTHRAFLRNNTGETQGYVTRLITPVMRLDTVYQPMIVFWYANPKWTADRDTLRVLYKTGPKANWQKLAEYSTASADWQKVALSLPEYNETYQVAFEGTDNLGRGIVLDSVVVRSAPECTVPHDMKISTVKSGKATLTWTASWDANEFRVLILTDSVALDTLDRVSDKQIMYDDTIDGLKHSFEVSIKTPGMEKGLESGGVYYAYVRSICETETSDWSKAYEFRMAAIKYIPYTQNFNMSYKEEIISRDLEWTWGNNTGNFNPFINTNLEEKERAKYAKDKTTCIVFSGANAVATVIPAGKYVYLSTPALADSTTGNFQLKDCQVRFWSTVYQYTGKYAHSIIVGVMTDAEDFTTFVPVDTVSVWGQETFQENIVNLESYQGDGKFVAFVSNFDKQNLFYLDDVTIERRPAVNKVTKVFVNPRDTFATISWEGNASSYRVLVTKSEVDPTAPKLDEVIVDSTLDANSFVCKGLEAAHSWDKPYYVYVKADDKEWSYRYPFVTISRIQALPTVFKMEESEGYYTLKGVKYPNNIGVFSNDPEYPHLYTTNPYAGKSCLYLSKDPGNDSWITFPIEENIKDRQLTFYLSGNTTASQVRATVGTMSNPMDISTFEPIEEFVNISSYVRCYVNFANYKGTNEIIAIVWTDTEEGKNTNNYIDNVSIAEIATCLPPSEIKFSALTSDSIAITWPETVRESWEVIVSKTVIPALEQEKSFNEIINGYYADQFIFTDTIEWVDKAVNPVFGIGGLEYSTPYYIYLRSICGGEETWWAEVSATTPCPEIFKAPYTETFDKGTGTELGCWKGYDMGGTGYPKLLAPSSDANSLGQALELWSTGTTHRSWAVAPKVDMSFDDMIVDFYARSYSASTASVLYVGFMTDPQDSATFMPIDTLYIPNGKAYYHRGIDLAPYKAHEGEYIAFTSGLSSKLEKNSDLYLDNVTFKSSRCAAPYNIVAADAQISSLDIEWEGKTEDKWEVKVLSKYAKLDTKLNKIAKYDTAKVAIVNDTILESAFLHVENLKPLTKYYVYVRPTCGDSIWAVDTLRTGCKKINPKEVNKEDFESYPAGTSYGATYQADCWVTGNNNPAASTTYLPYIYQGGTYASSGDKSYRMYGYYSSTATPPYNCPAWIATPEIDCSNMKNLYVAFSYYMATTSGYALLLGVMTDPEDLGTFVVLDSITGTGSVVSYGIDLRDYADSIPSEARYFAWRTPYNASTTVYIDDVTILEQTCPFVKPSYSDLSSDRVRINSGLPSDDTEWILLISESKLRADSLNKEGFKYPDSIFVFKDTISSRSKMVTGLKERTDYYVAMASYCESKKPYWMVFTLTTLCAAVTPEALGTITFSDQEGYTVGSGSPMPCWVTGNKQGATGTRIPFVYSNTSYLHDGNRSVEFYSGTSSNNGAYAIMPKLDIESIKDYQVNFWATSWATSQNKLIVGVITDPTDLNTFVVTDTVTDIPKSSNWKYFTVPFDKYEGDYLGNYGKYIMFLSEFDGTNDVNITEVLVEKIPTCDYVQEIVVDSVGEDFAMLSWKSEAPKARLLMSDKVVPDSVKATYTKWLVDTVVTKFDSVRVDDLNAASIYYAYVQNICSASDTAKVSSARATFLTDCPDLTGFKAPYSTDFDANTATGTGKRPDCWKGVYLTFDTVGTTQTYPYVYTSYAYSGKNDLYMYSYGYYNSTQKKYTSNTKCIAVAPLIKGNQNDYMISFYARQTSTGTSYGKKLVIGYVTNTDQKQIDKTFVKLGDVEITGTTYQYYEFTLVDKATIPAGAHLALRADWSDQGFSPTQASQYANFYIDNFKIGLPPTCYPPTIKAGKSTLTSIEVKITPAEQGGSLWELAVIPDSVYKKIDDIKKYLDTITNTVLADSMNYMVPNMTPEVKYQVYARTVCGGEDGNSDWTESPLLLFAYKTGYKFGFEKSEDWVRSPLATSDDYYMHPLLVAGYDTIGSATTSYSYYPYCYVNTSSAIYAYGPNTGKLGTGSMRFYAYSTYYGAYVIFPGIADAKARSFEFKVRPGYLTKSTMKPSTTYASQLQVGMVDRGAGMETFELLTTIDLEKLNTATVADEDNNYLYKNFTIDLDSATVANKQIVLYQPKVIAGSSYAYNYIDDVIMGAPKGAGVVEIDHVFVASDSAAITWKNISGPWNLLLTTEHYDDEMLAMVTDTVLNVKNIEENKYSMPHLKPHTTYTAILSSAGTVTGYEKLKATKTFSTLCDPIDPDADGVFFWDFNDRTEWDRSDVLVGGANANTTDTCYWKPGCFTVGTTYEGTQTTSTVYYNWLIQRKGYGYTGAPTGNPATGASSNARYEYGLKETPALRIFSSSTYMTPYIVLPALKCDLDTMMIEFWGRCFANYAHNYGAAASQDKMVSATYLGSSYSKSIVVGTLDDPHDFSSLEIIDTLTYNAYTSTTAIKVTEDPNGLRYWQKLQAPLSGAKGKYIVLFQPAYGLFFLDDLSVKPIGDNIFAPFGPVTESVTKTSATVSWKVKHPSLKSVVVVMDEDGVKEISRDTVDGTSCTVNGLKPATIYQWYMYQIKGTIESAKTGRVSFHTDCEAVDPSYSTGFESGSEGYWILPGQTSDTYKQNKCWVYGNAGTSAPGTNSYNYMNTATSGYSHSGEYAARLYATGTTYQTYLAMPAMDVAAFDTLQVNFWMCPGYHGLGTSSYADEVYYTYTGDTYAKSVIVGTMTDPNDPTTFVPIDTVTYDGTFVDHDPCNAENDYLYQKCKIGLRGATGPYVTFMASLTRKGGMKVSSEIVYLDDVWFSKLQECNEPTKLEASDVTAYTATVSWEGNALCQEYVLQVSTDASFYYDTAFVFNDTLSATSYDLTNLQAQTTYAWRVKSICSTEFGVSDYTQNITFTTSRVPFFLEDFRSSTLDSDWKFATNNGELVFDSASVAFTGSNNTSYGWRRLTTEAGLPTAHYAILFNTSSSTSTSYRYYWMISPLVELPAGKPAHLTADVALTQASSTTISANPATPANVADDYAIVVAISEDGGKSWAKKNTLRISGKELLGIPATGTNVRIDLSKYAGKPIKIALYREAITYQSANAAFHVDNIRINYFNEQQKSVTSCQYEDIEALDFYIDGDKVTAGEHEYRRNVLQNEYNAASLKKQDTTFVLNANVLAVPETIIEDTICEGSSYTSHDFHGKTQTGVYARKLQGVNNCDSICRLHLYVRPKERTLIEDTICQGQKYPFNGKVYETTTVDSVVLTSIHGCDSIVTLVLTVVDAFRSEFSDSFCAGTSYEWKAAGKTYTAAGDYTETLRTASGCDSIVTLHLSERKVYNEKTTVSICEGSTYKFGDKDLSLPGEYTYTFESALGCDSTVTLTLEISDKYRDTIKAEIQEGETYMFYDVEYDEEGTYDIERPGEDGDCDSLRVLVLTVTPVQAIENVNTYGELVLRPTILNAGETVRADYHFTKADLANLKVEVYDIVGRSVEAKTYDHQPIIIDAFPIAGVYTVRITTGTGLNLVGRVVVR